MFTRYFARLGVLFFAVLTFACAASAQTILVVDQSRIMQESNVGKHIQNQLLSIGTQMDSEVQSTSGTLKSEFESLRATSQNMTPEQRQARPDLAQRNAEFQKKMQNAQMEMAIKQRELDATRQKAAAQVNEKLAVIIKSIVDERGAELVVDRSLVIFSAPSIDITDEVIKRLNSQMRTVKVTRVRLPRK